MSKGETKVDLQTKEESTRKKRLTPQRVQLGWRLMTAGLILWAVLLVLDPVGTGVAIHIGISNGLRLELTYPLAILDILIAVATAIALLPFRRKRGARDWAIALLLFVIVITSIYHLSWQWRL